MAWPWSTAYWNKMLDRLAGDSVLALPAAPVPATPVRLPVKANKKRPPDSATLIHALEQDIQDIRINMDKIAIVDGPWENRSGR